MILTGPPAIGAVRHEAKNLEEELGGRLRVYAYTWHEIEESKERCAELFERTAESDFVLISVSGSIVQFRQFEKYKLILEKRPFFFQTGTAEENELMTPRTGLIPEISREIARYLADCSKENARSLLCYIAREVLRMEGIPVWQPPVYPCWAAIHDDTQSVKDEEGYLENVYSQGKPVVGILMSLHTHRMKDYAPADALMHSIRAMGGEALCIYAKTEPYPETGYGGLAGAFERYFMKDGKARIGALINMIGFSVTVLSAPEDENETLFTWLDVPVIQGMISDYTPEEFKTAYAGIPSGMIAYQVYQPEFDGQLIGFPMACTVRNEENQKRSVVMPERVDKLARLALNWARLRDLPPEKCKAALIFHNLPPRNDTIGTAFGLDSPESMFRIVNELKALGVQTEYEFSDSAEIINRVIEGLTNDGRWSTAERMLEKCAATVSDETYLAWYGELSDRVRAEMEENWGTPPGDNMAVEGDILIPGIINGNIFIGLQPQRGLLEKAEELLHNTHIVCPHQYVGFYKWIEHVFRADVIIHVGTHGSLEWLPGKEVALDGDSYPDIAIGTLPNLYPYVVCIPGEGAQAKRRSYAALVDYLIPSITEGGLYEELSDLDGMLREYYDARLSDRERSLEVGRRIWALAQQCNITDDIGLTDEDARRDLEECLDRIHVWVSKVQYSSIWDGLHIFGQVPQGERMSNMLRTLVRVANGEVPSLREGLAQAAGVSLDELLNAPEALKADGRTNAMILEELDQTGRDLFELWRQEGFSVRSIDRVIEEKLTFCSGNLGMLRECMKFTAEFIYPRILQTGREMESLLKGFRGHAVPTGPSGNPSRGGAHLLPTGKNFYTIDPATVPTRDAMRTGKVMVEQLIERYRADEGRIPESITTMTTAGATMRTMGEDIAELLCLLGLRPVWLGTSERVIGLEVVPLEELGRARIDVTLRVSGMFRDAFPNLIERIEDAVNMVAVLEEPLEQNYVRKHILEECEELMQEGEARETAFERASLRMFGCPANTYGAGVKELVQSKKWETVEDLGEVYTTWGCHAYGRKIHGETCRADYIRRMARADLTVTNASTIEFDVLSSEDFYNYIGGMIAAIETHSGSQKRAYVADSADCGHTHISSLHEEVSRIMRARVNNPKWIEGMKQHGYKGAQEISRTVSTLFGLDATTRVADNWMYESIAKRYLLDETNAQWLQENNLFALQNITEILLEASLRGMWDAPDEMLDQLRELFVSIDGGIEELD